MAENLIPCHFCKSILGVYFVFLYLLFTRCYSYVEPAAFNSFTVSSYRYPQTRLRPFEWRYIRVDLPPWFSSVSVVLESNVDLDPKSISKISKSALPLICFRDGSFPLPDVSETSLKSFGSLSNGSSEEIEMIQDVEQCYPMQKNISLRLTNEQVSPGVWYLGLFNGAGAIRTQSKMIIRGTSYTFGTNISVEGCTTSTLWGPYCNQTVVPLTCAVYDHHNLTDKFSYSGEDSGEDNRTTGNTVSCRNNFDSRCLKNGEFRVYSLDVLGIAKELSTTAMNVNFNTSSKNTVNTSGINIMCFARHGALPSTTLYDYSVDIYKEPLTIQSPKVGRWYFTIITNVSEELGSVLGKNVQVCYSVALQVVECPVGKGGPNCTWESYALQTIRGSAFLFESSYIPVSTKISVNSAEFPLEPFLSNATYDGALDDRWTYFVMDVPFGAGGGNIHFNLKSHTKIKYEIYAKFGGLPSLQSWDYYYANTSKSSHSSMFFESYSSEKEVDFYIVYVREGTWSLGIRHLNTSGSETTMSVSVERCPKGCKPYGQCRYAFDASGLTSYSYCACDRRHGGFDCSIEIVSHQGHIWQSISLIASNAAALLPAYRALQQKAFAEWVLFTSSGISSGLYHACDVQTWCALSFNVLQFMDFWLSFMAVVSTFVYLTTIDESFKRTIHTVVAILTALMAITKATRSSNIILVISIGALGLLVGWLVELSTKYRSLSFSFGSCVNIRDRQQAIIPWIRDLCKTFLRRFRYVYLVAGFIALAIAGISWQLETSQSYWIWHSLWHVTIYTSSFFFLCSKVTDVSSENQSPPVENYELTRLDSFQRGE